jgi:UDP-glucose 4-epimerase
LIGIFERLKKEDEIFTVTGTGEQRRDFTHIDDIVDALIKCGEKHFFDGGSEINGQTLELGRGKNYSVMEIVKAFDEEVVRYLPARPGEMKETLCTDTKAKELLGWKPTINVIDYIKEILT